MTPRLSDDEVSGLPLAEARAELLEEIMSTSTTERATPTADDPAPRHLRRWAATLGAAAAAAALVAVPSWLLTRDEPASLYAAPAPHQWVVLDAPGWAVTHVSDPGGGESEVEWSQGGAGGEGGATLTVHLRDAEDRDGYVEDRSRIDAPRVDPGTPVELLGEPALSWAYASDDHTTIGAVDGTVYPEVRGSGMGRPAYLELLASLSWTDEAGFEAALPPEFVTVGEADAEIAGMLRGIPLAPGAEVPRSGENDPYQLGADVAAQVVCPWLDEFARAKETDDRPAVRRVQQVLGDSRGWAFLQSMDAEGDYPEVVWEMSAEVVAGRVPAEYEQGLGCE